METKSKTGYTEGIGRRKTSTARVRLTVASRDSIAVNDKDWKEFFPTLELQKTISRVKEISGTTDKYLITVRVNGGGVHSQAEAVALGLSRALVKVVAETKAPLKKAGLLTRDAREKERRKFGLKKARKAPQWSKR